MSRMFQRAALLALVLAVGLTLTATAFAQTKVLRFANWVPPTHHMNNTLAAWNAELERASGGTLKIQILPPGLAKPPGQYDLAKNGVVDLVWGVPGYTPGRFHMVRVHELPFLYPNAEVASMSLWQWYDKHGFEKDEFKDTKLIMLFGHGRGLLHSKRPVSSLDGVKGLKIRAGGAGVALAKHIGAVPVSMPASQAYEALQRGTAEAIFFPFEAIKSFSLVKLVTYHVDFEVGLYSSPFYITLNRNTWNNLSAEHKAVLNHVGRAWGSQMMGRYWDAADRGGIDLAKANGNHFSTITGAQFQAFKRAVAPIEKEWVDKANSLGYNGKALLADLEATITANSK